MDVDRLGRMSFSTFESNVLFVLRFMIDTGVVGGCWITAQAGKYSVAGGGGNSTRPKLSTCQIDIHMNYRCGASAPFIARKSWQSASHSERLENLNI